MKKAKKAMPMKPMMKAKDMMMKEKQMKKMMGAKSSKKRK